MRHFGVPNYTKGQAASVVVLSAVAPAYVSVCTLRKGEDVVKVGKAPKKEITFYAVWREPPSESLMVESGVRTLVDHLERRSKQRRRYPSATATSCSLD